MKKYLLLTLALALCLSLFALPAMMEEVPAKDNTQLAEEEILQGIENYEEPVGYPVDDEGNALYGCCACSFMAMEDDSFTYEGFEEEGLEGDGMDWDIQEEGDFELTDEDEQDYAFDYESAAEEFVEQEEGLDLGEDDLVVDELSEIEQADSSESAGQQELVSKAYELMEELSKILAELESGR